MKRSLTAQAQTNLEDDPNNKSINSSVVLDSNLQEANKDLYDKIDGLYHRVEAMQEEQRSAAQEQASREIKLEMRCLSQCSADQEQDDEELSYMAGNDGVLLNKIAQLESMVRVIKRE